MKKLAFLGGAAGMGMIALLGIHHSQAADHLDSPATLAPQPMADINDVYAWMTTDGAKVNLAMTVSPADNVTFTGGPPATAKHFGPTVVYAIHLTSRPGFGMAGQESKIICKFADDTHGQCFLTDPAGKTLDYVTGDLSSTAGRLSASGKFRVFAGTRSDPFFFNLGGARDAIVTAETVCGGGVTPGRCPPPVSGTTDAAGCFKITAATGSALRSKMSTKPSADRTDTPICDDSADIDCFVGLNVKAIVIQVDKTELLQGADKLLSVWGSTHVGS